MVVVHGEKEDGEGGHLHLSLIILTCKCKKGVAVDFFLTFIYLAWIVYVRMLTSQCMRRGCGSGTSAFTS